MPGRAETWRGAFEGTGATGGRILFAWRCADAATAFGCCRSAGSGEMMFVVVARAGGDGACEKCLEVRQCGIVLGLINLTRCDEVLRRSRLLYLEGESVFHAMRDDRKSIYFDRRGRRRGVCMVTPSSACLTVMKCNTRL